LNGLTGDLQVQLNNLQPKLMGDPNEIVLGDGSSLPLSSISRQVNVINNLTSTSSTDSLSAAMGKKLNDDRQSIYRQVNNDTSGVTDVVIENIGNHLIEITPNNDYEEIRISLDIENLRNRWNDIYHNGGSVIKELVIPFTVRLMPNPNFPDCMQYILDIAVFDSGNDEIPISRDDSYIFFAFGIQNFVSSKEIIDELDLDVIPNCLIYAINGSTELNTPVWMPFVTVSARFNMSFSFSSNGAVSYSINPISI
jgi:hypothetical protein